MYTVIVDFQSADEMAIILTKDINGQVSLFQGSFDQCSEYVFTKVNLGEPDPESYIYGE